MFLFIGDMIVSTENLKEFNNSKLLELISNDREVVGNKLIYKNQLLYCISEMNK